MKKESVSFAENLKRFRKERDITALQLAELLNVAPTTVSTWERGKSYPDLLKFVELCRVLSVSSDEMLFGRVDEPLENMSEMQKFIIRMLVKEFQNTP